MAADARAALYYTNDPKRGDDNQQSLHKTVMEAAVALLARFDEGAEPIALVDATLLDSRPQWLSSVPTLAEITETGLKVTYADRVLQALQQFEPPAPPQPDRPAPGGAAAARGVRPQRPAARPSRAPRQTMPMNTAPPGEGRIAIDGGTAGNNGPRGADGGLEEAARRAMEAMRAR